MSKLSSCYSLAKMDIVRAYKKVFLRCQHLEKVLTDDFGITSKELVDIRRIAREEEAKRAEDLYSLTK